jgi:hypothetical protein
MKIARRQFLTGSSLCIGALADLDIAAGAPASSAASSGGLDLLKTPYDSQVASLTYNSLVEGAAPPPTPNALLFWDRKQKKFVSPLEVTATRDKGSYAITSALRSFNISKTSFATARNSNQEVQIGLNFTAPITTAGDNFAWITKNAVNIFLAKKSDVSGALASFKTANPAAAPAAPTNKVQVLQGAFDLQVNAFFQPKQGFWRKLFQSLGGVPGTPLIAGLGIPGIALAGLDFVLYTFNKLTQGEVLPPLWNAKPLPFALTKGVTRDFGFTDGLWCIVDSSVMKPTKLLQGYSIDLTDETYQVVDENGKQLDANYLVAQFDVSSIGQ